MNKYIDKRAAGYWRAIAALFLGSFVTFAILYCTQPLITVFSTEFSITPAAASLTVSLTTGFMAGGLLFAAWLSDRLGRKKIMAAALMISALLLILGALSNDYRLLLLIRALHGIVLAGFPAIAMVYINEEFDPAISGLVMGIYVSGTSIGGLSGRLIVSGVTDFFSWQWALGTTGLVSLLAGICFWRWLPESRNFVSRKIPMGEMAGILSHLLHNRLLLALYAIAFFIMGSFVTLYNYIGGVLLSAPYNLSQTAAGLIFMVYLVGTVSSTLMGRFSDGGGKAKVLCLALGLMLAGCLVTLHPVLAVKTAGIAVFTFGFFGAHAVASSWTAQCCGDGKAQASALYLLFYYLGASIMGTTGGSLFSAYGWNGVVVLIGSAVLLAAVIALELFWHASDKFMVAAQDITSSS